MPSNLPTVSVVIPASDAAETLPRALRSVAAQDYPNIVEVIVAAADDRSAAAAADALVVTNPEGSTPAGLNRGIAASTGDVIVRCDAHAVLPPDYVSTAVETLQRTGADNVGGMQVPQGETPWGRAIAAAMTHPFGAGDARYRLGGEEGPVETVYLGVFRRETLDSIGGFDEAFSRTQDYELNHRIIRSGGTVWFTPEMRVTYTPRDSLAALAIQYYRYGQAKRLFRRKHPGALRLRQMAPPILVVTMGAAMVAAVWQPLLLLLPATYALAMFGAGVVSDHGSLRVGAALIAIHVSWGLGYLVGAR